jgi:hypothetical protein
MGESMATMPEAGNEQHNAESSLENAAEIVEYDTNMPEIDLETKYSQLKNLEGDQRLDFIKDVLTNEIVDHFRKQKSAADSKGTPLPKINIGTVMAVVKMYLDNYRPFGDQQDVKSTFSEKLEKQVIGDLKMFEIIEQ